MVNPDPIARAIQSTYPALSEGDCSHLARQLTGLLNRVIAGGWTPGELQLYARGGKRNGPLQRLRLQAGLTVAQVAEACCWSISKLNRLEAGAVSASRTDLAFLLQLYKVTDRTVIEEVMKQARRPKR